MASGDDKRVKRQLIESYDFLIDEMFICTCCSKFYGFDIVVAIIRVTSPMYFSLFVDGFSTTMNDFEMKASS